MPGFAALKQLKPHVSKGKFSTDCLLHISSYMRGLVFEKMISQGLNTHDVSRNASLMLAFVCGLS